MVTSRQNHSNIECYYAVLRRPITERFRSYSFIFLSSTATSSATGGYVVVPERPSRNEEQTSRNNEQTRKIPSSNLVLLQNLVNELICILPVLVHEILSHLRHLFYFHSNYLMIFFKYLPTRENVCCTIFLNIYLLFSRKWTLWCPFPKDQARLFSIERCRWRGLWGWKCREKCFFSCQNWHFVFVDNIITYFSLLCALT